MLVIIIQVIQNVLIYFLIFLLIVQSLFFSNDFTQGVFGDEILSSGSVVSRLGLFGYVSNTFAIILSFLITFLAHRLLHKFNIFSFIFILVLSVLLLQTFSRTGIISAYLGVLIILFYRNSFYGFLFLIIPPILIFSYLQVFHFL